MRRPAGRPQAPLQRPLSAAMICAALSPAPPTSEHACPSLRLGLSRGILSTRVPACGWAFRAEWGADSARRAETEGARVSRYDCPLFTHAYPISADGFVICADRLWRPRRYSCPFLVGLMMFQAPSRRSAASTPYKGKHLCRAFPIPQSVFSTIHIFHDQSPAHIHLIAPHTILSHYS